MALLKAIAFDADRLKRLYASSLKQDPRVSAYNRSNDPENFPVFSTPKTGAYLVYVPNHFSLDSETETRQLREDHVYLHRVNDGSRYGTMYRCARGVVSEEDGFDGSCPLCDGAQDSFAWYNTAIALREAQYGHPIKGVEDKDAKAIRQHLLEQRPVYLVEDRHVFPIVVIDCDQKKYTPKLVDGKLSYKICWYECSDNQFSKLLVPLKLQDDQCPAGRLFLFDYSYDSKGQEPNARDAARNLTVSLLPDNRGLPDEALEGFDKLTEPWTPIKAMETVKISAYYTPEQLQSLTTQVMGSKLRETELMKQELDSFSGTQGNVNKLSERRSSLDQGSEVTSEVVEDLPDVRSVRAIMKGDF